MTMNNHAPDEKLAKEFHNWLADSPVHFSVQHTSNSEAYTVTFFLKSKSTKQNA